LSALIGAAPSFAKPQHAARAPASLNSNHPKTREARYRRGASSLNVGIPMHHFRAARLSRSSILSAALIAAALALPGSARAAEPTAADKETARALVAKGQSLYDAKDYPGALKAFRAAHAIMGLPTTGVPLGKAEIELGLLVEARDTLLEVTRYPKKPSEPEAFARARTEAARLADTISGRIATIELSFSSAAPGAPGAVIIDGVEIPLEAVSAPRRVNPGKHNIIVRVEGHDLASVDVVVGEGESKTVPITLHEQGQNASAAPPPPPPPEQQPTQPPPPSTTKTSPLVYIGFGVGGAGIVAGAITGLMAMSSASSAKDQCIDTRCHASAQDDIDSAKTTGTISTIAFGVGIVGIGVGIYGLLSPSHVEAHVGSNEPRKPQGLTITPAFGPGSFSLHGSF
jgi:hypothetical protein